MRRQLPSRGESRGAAAASVAAPSATSMTTTFAAAAAAVMFATTSRSAAVRRGAGAPREPHARHAALCAALAAALGLTLGVALCVAVARPRAVGRAWWGGVVGEMAASVDAVVARRERGAAAGAASGPESVPETAAAVAAAAAASDAAEAAVAVPAAWPGPGVGLAPGDSGTTNAKQSSQGAHAVTVWIPQYARKCHGRFASAPARDSPGGFPYAIVRDAVVDNRFASRKEFRRRRNKIRAFQRLVLYVTAHLSVKFVQPAADKAATAAPDQSSPVSGNLVITDEDDQTAPARTPNLTGQQTQTDRGPVVVADVAVAVDYVLHVNPFVVQPVYKPGTTTVYGQDVSEWQIVVSLSPAYPSAYEREELFAARLRALVDHGAYLNLSLPLLRYDGEKVEFRPSLALACVMGLAGATQLPNQKRFQQHEACRQHADGAVAFAGSALHGHKRSDPKRVIEIAHFAARALTGSLRFDSVR
jgi:hypothetical protein